MHRSLDPEGYSWGTLEELTAALIEVTDFGNRQFFAAHAGKHSKRPEPIRVPRPGQLAVPENPEPAPKMSSPEEIRRFLHVVKER